jgi:hypothetical protein
VIREVVRNLSLTGQRMQREADEKASIRIVSELYEGGRTGVV